MPTEPSTGSRYVLTLYVSGRTSRSEQAILNLRRICEQVLEGRCQLTIVDVLECPEVAEDERILATPTVVRREPTPPRRIIGDLSDMAKVLLGLELTHPVG
jgi:circadian clock protein KaiB